MEEENVTQEITAYRTCPMNGKRVAKAVCSAKVQKGVCLQDGDECHTVGKHRDRGQEKFIKTFSGDEDNPIGTKPTKKAKRAQKKSEALETDKASKAIMGKASQTATVDKPSPPPKTLEQRIVEERVAAGDEATLALIEIETQLTTKGGKIMKTKKAVKKAKANKVQAVKKVATKAQAEKVEKDGYGFRKGSLSSDAIKMLASGKAVMKDTRKQFNTLSFATLLAQLEKNGFKVKEDANGLCSIA